ncbi:sporulation and spore germination [Clostridium sp. CAG:167]|nr:sporulation and spore germination [Clostridium sp. CAG:167]
MKGKKVLCILCTVILVFGMTGCGEKTDKQLMSYQVFYINSDGSGLTGKTYQLKDAKQDLVSVIKELIIRLQTPQEESLKSPIDEGIQVVDYQIKENQLSVYFSAGYNNKSGLDEILSRAAIVKTLCQIQEIEYVEFYVEDQPLMLSGNAVGLMSQESFVDELNPQDQKQSKETVLYFANKQGNRLKKITTDITYNAVEPIARLLVEQLIAGVSSIQNIDETKLQSAVPSKTTLNNLTIRDNICYLDLSRDFEQQDPNVSSEVIVYSIVDTLCELPEVTKVQFSVDGEQKEKYGDLEGFNKPLERNLDLLEN